MSKRQIRKEQQPILGKDWLHQLFQQLECKKTVCWKLSEEKAELLRAEGLKVEICLYVITTKRWHNVKNLPGILKQLHYSNKPEIFRSLKKSDRKILDEYGVRYAPYKYEISR